MIARAAWIIVLLAALSFVAACEREPLTEYTGYVTEDIPPCTPIEGSTVNPCEPGEVDIAESVPELGDEPSGVRDMLEGGLSPPAWVSHLALRGTYIPDTVRCTAGDAFRSVPYLQDEFDYDDNPRAVKCYIDIRVNSYVFGSGPSALTVLLVNYIYWDDQLTPYLEEGQTEQNPIEETRRQFETDINDVFPGREHILFLGPGVDLSSEAWRFLGYWDVQRKEDGTVIVVHPRRDLWQRRRPDDYVTHRSSLEMGLPAFTQAVAAAHQARVIEYDGRIGEDEDLPGLVTDAKNLRDYYIEVGAYDEGEPTPAQPPP